ncbi:DUF932 domain-containing protein [Candidatus Parcubacteria bacterium]|nr:MAG: DUF932 domain-containing protein [Candidatus Parcubacteria bacterium]
MKELQNLYNQLLQENTKKVDIITPISSAEFIAEGDKNYLLLRKGETLPSEYHDFRFGDIRDRVLELSSHALQQLCSKIGVPMSYINKCEPEAREYNIGHWLKKTDGNNLFRCILEKDSSRVRGILSDRYTPVADSFVVSSLKNAIEASNIDNPLVTRIYAGEEMLRVQVSDGKKPVVNDTTLGFYCGNSEIGLSTIFIEAGLYTFKCTNGLRVPNFSFEFNRRHVGNISYNQIGSNFHNQINNIMNNYSRMVSYMKIANQITMKKTSFSKFIEDSKNFSVPLKDNMKARIKKLSAENVLWAYVSQMTEEAHYYKEQERMEIEKQAGLYMDGIIQKEVKRGRYELAAV